MLDDHLLKASVRYSIDEQLRDVDNNIRGFFLYVEAYTVEKQFPKFAFAIRHHHHIQFTVSSNVL